MYNMKKLTVTDLRYRFPKVERALRTAKEIQITKRNHVIGRLIRDAGDKSAAKHSPRI